jgi:hypothetical protein
VTARLFMDPEFVSRATKNDVTSDMLCAAAKEIEAGLIDARLGGHLVKERVAAPGRGERGRYRTILACRHADRLVFLHGFEKKEKENISQAERGVLLKLGDQYMKYDGPMPARLGEQGLLVEINCHDQPNT